MNKPTNPLITFIPFEARGRPKLQSCLQHAKNALTTIRTMRVQQNTNQQRQTAYVSKQLTMVHKPVIKTHNTDFVRYKQDQCYISTSGLKHSTFTSYQSAQTTKTDDFQSSQSVKGHVIHRPVAIRPEVKTGQKYSNVSHTGVISPVYTAPSPINIRNTTPISSVTVQKYPSVARTGVSSPAYTALSPINMRNTTPISSVSVRSIPSQIPSSSLNVVTTKKFPSYVSSVSVIRSCPSLNTNQTTAARDSFVSMNVANTSVVSASSAIKCVSASVVNSASKYVTENRNCVPFNERVVNRNVSTISTSSSHESNKYVLLTEVGPSIADNSALHVLSSPKVHNTNMFNMTSCQTPPQSVVKSSQLDEENCILTTFAQKVDAAVLPGTANLSTDSLTSGVKKVSALLPNVNSKCIKPGSDSDEQVQQSERFRRKSSESVFMRKESLNAERKLKCRECDGEFITHLAYHTHMIFHVRNDPVRKTEYKKQTVCSYCGKHFANAFTLKSHMYKHTGEKPFICPYCQRMFADRSNCRAHMRLHTDKKKIFSCTSCNKSFSQRRYLYKHMVEICKVPERMFRTSLMSVKYHPEDDENSDTLMKKQVITRFRNNNEALVHSMNEDGFQIGEHLDDYSLSGIDNVTETKYSRMLEKTDLSEENRKHKNDVINSCSVSMKKEPSTCVQPKMSPYVSCVRIDEKINSLPRKSRKQDLSKTRVLLPDKFTMDGNPVIICKRIDDELPYLKPLFKEIFSNPNAYLTLHPVSDNVINTDDPSCYIYKLSVGKSSKLAANIEGEDEEAIKAAKLAAAKEWQSRLVNGDFTTDEEEDDDDEEEEDESSAEDNKRNVFKRKRVFSSSDDTDFTSDEDFTPKTCNLHTWSSRRRRFRRIVKPVNFKHLHRGTVDSDNSASSAESIKCRSSSHLTTNKPKQVGKIIVRKIQAGKNTKHEIVRSEESNTERKPDKVIEPKVSNTRLFGKGSRESTPCDTTEQKEDENKTNETEREKFHCVECDLKFMQQTNLVLHIVTNHLQTASFYQRHYYGSEQFVCKYCEKACYSFQSFIQHVPVHTNDVLEKMAKYVISKSGRHHKRIKKERRFDIHNKQSKKIYLPNIRNEEPSSKHCEPKVKESASVVQNSADSVQARPTQDEYNTSAKSVEEKSCYSSKSSESNQVISLTKVKNTNTDVNDKSPQNQTTNNEAVHNNNTKSVLNRYKVKVTSPEYAHGSRKRIVIEIKENAVLKDLSPHKISKTCGSQTDLVDVKTKHSRVPVSRHHITLPFPKATIKRRQIKINTNGVSVKKETDIQQSRSIETKPTLTKSSSFMDSFLSYVKTEESKFKNIKQAELQYYKPLKINSTEKSKSYRANENIKNNINSNTLEDNIRQSTPNYHESKSSSSVLNGRMKKVSNMTNSEKTTTSPDVGSPNSDPVVKLENQDTSDNKNISSKHGQKPLVGDEKTCDSSSIGQISFSNCSQSAEDHSSSDIIAFDTDLVMSGTDEQTLDKLTQLRVSRTRSQQVASTGHEAPTPEVRPSEASNCEDSLQILSMKTLSSESAALGEVEECLFDSDSVLNTMLNLATDVSTVSEVNSDKVSHLSATKSVHQEEKPNTNVQVDRSVKESSSQSDKQVLNINKKSSVSDVNVDGKLTKDNTCCSSVSSLHGDDLVKTDTNLMQKHCQNNGNKCSSMEGKLSPASEGISNVSQNLSISHTYDDVQDLCSMSQASDTETDLRISSLENVREVCSEDASLQLQDLDASDIAIECEATLQTTPLLSQIVPDLTDGISDAIDKDVDEIAISCEGTLKSVIVNINIDESNSGSPVLIEDEIVQSNSATILSQDESAQIAFKTTGSSSVSECSEDSVSMDTEDSLTESDASLAASQHNVSRSGRTIKPPKRCREWFSKNLSSKRQCVNSTVKKRVKYKNLHADKSARDSSPVSSLDENVTFKHDPGCATRKSPRSEHSSKTKTCPCCL